MVGTWKVEPAQARLVRCSEIVKIDPRNVRLLRLLASRAGNLVLQSEIEQIVWSGSIISSDSIYQSIAQLRRALGETAEDRYIQTIPRKGYRLIASVDFSDEQKSSETIHASPPLPTVEVMASERTQNVSRSAWRTRQWAAPAALCAFVMVGGFAMFDSRRPAIDDSPPASITAPEHRDVAAIADLGELPVHLQGAASYRETIRRLQQMLSSQSANPGTEQFEIVRTLLPLAQQALLAGDPLQSEAFARRGLRILDHLKRDVSPTGIGLHLCLAQALRATHRFALAEQHLRKALAHSRQLNSDEHAATILLLNQVALLRIAEGRFDEAEEESRTAIASYEQLTDRTPSFAAYLSSTLMSALIHQGRHDEAISIGMSSLALLTPGHAPEPYLVAKMYHALGEALLRAGRPGEAEPLLQREIALLKSTPHPDADMTRAENVLEEARRNVAAHSNSRVMRASRCASELDTHGTAEAEACERRVGPRASPSTASS